MPSAAGSVAPSVTVSTGMPRTAASASVTDCASEPVTYITEQSGLPVTRAMRRMTIGRPATLWPFTARSSKEPSGSLPTTQTVKLPSGNSAAGLGHSTKGANLCRYVAFTAYSNGEPSDQADFSAANTASHTTTQQVGP